MPDTVDLTRIGSDELRNFVESFDIVLSDGDGVLWQVDAPLEGAVESLKMLQELGKRTYLVSNNSTLSAEFYCNVFRERGFDARPDQIILPSKILPWYLKTIGFDKEAFAIVSTPFRESLISEGIKLHEPDLSYPEDAQAMIQAIQDKPSVGAVIVDFDAYLSYAKMAHAAVILKRDDVLYLVGAVDRRFKCGKGYTYLGPGMFMNILTEHTGRTPLQCGKPGTVLKDYIIKTCNVVDTRRCLFIGDSIESDIRFGKKCGFRTLLVGTGINTLDEARTADCEPDYYISSISQLTPILRDVYGTNR